MGDVFPLLERDPAVEPGPGQPQPEPGITACHPRDHPCPERRGEMGELPEPARFLIARCRLRFGREAVPAVEIPQGHAAVRRQRRHQRPLPGQEIRPQPGLVENLEQGRRHRRDQQGQPDVVCAAERHQRAQAAQLRQRRAAGQIARAPQRLPHILRGLLDEQRAGAVGGDPVAEDRIGGIAVARDGGLRRSLLEHRAQAVLEGAERQRGEEHVVQPLPQADPRRQPGGRRQEAPPGARTPRHRSLVPKEILEIELDDGIFQSPGGPGLAQEGEQLGLARAIDRQIVHRPHPGRPQRAVRIEAVVGAGTAQDDGDRAPPLHLIGLDHALMRSGPGLERIEPGDARHPEHRIRIDDHVECRHQGQHGDERAEPDPAEAGHRAQNCQ